MYKNLEDLVEEIALQLGRFWASGGKDKEIFKHQNWHKTQYLLDLRNGGGAKIYIAHESEEVVMRYEERAKRYANAFSDKTKSEDFALWFGLLKGLEKGRSDIFGFIAMLAAAHVKETGTETEDYSEVDCKVIENAFLVSFGRIDKDVRTLAYCLGLFWASGCKDKEIFSDENTAKFHRLLYLQEKGLYIEFNHQGFKEQMKGFEYVEVNPKSLVFDFYSELAKNNQLLASCLVRDTGDSQSVESGFFSEKLFSFIAALALVNCNLIADERDGRGKSAYNWHYLKMRLNHFFSTKFRNKFL